MQARTLTALSLSFMCPFCPPCLRLQHAVKNYPLRFRFMTAFVAGMSGGISYTAASWKYNSKVPAVAVVAAGSSSSSSSSSREASSSSSSSSSPAAQEDSSTSSAPSVEGSID